MLVTANLNDQNDDLLVERVTIDGRDFWHDLERRKLLPVIAGGDGSDDEPGGEGDEGDEPDPAAGDKTLTQDQVNKIVSREKAAAERAERKKLSDWLASQKSDQDKATMDEAQRAKAEADEAKAESEKLRAEARRERLDAKIERKLSAAGVDEKALARAARLVDLDVEASDDDITAEIEQLKTDMPGLFATASDDGDDKGKTKKGAPSGVTTGKPPAGGQGAKSAMERGRELWEQKARKNNTTTAA